ncbi:pyrroline-5-carboxylate reductase [Elusimicrobiota bacterium]
MKYKKNISVIGCGKMGSIILEAISERFPDYGIIGIETNENTLRSLQRFTVYGTLEKVIDSDVIVIAVKPQNIKELLNELSLILKRIDKKVLLISIAAGIKKELIEKLLNNDRIEVIRAMPNTPSSVKKGVTALSDTAALDEASREIVEKIFLAMGMIFYTDHFDAVTALSGSGPAYFFRIAEIMEEFAVKNGLTPSDARTIAAETIRGSGELMSGSELSFKELRENVTSPGGTTQAALEFFNENSFEEILKLWLQQ